MTKILNLCLFAVFSFIVSACAGDIDTPTPTKTPVAAAPPSGTIVVPDPIAPLPVKTTKIVDYDPEGHASRIVVAGTDRWEKFVGYRVCADATEEMLITRISIESGTNPGLRMDNADFAAVGVRFYSDIVGVGIMPAGSSGKVSIEMKPAIKVGKGGCTPFSIEAKIAPVMASSTVGGSWSGVCRSGHAPALGLAKKASDVAFYDIDIVGEKTGMQYVAPVNDLVHRGHPMVIRKSEPIVTVQSLASTTLANIDLDLLKFQVAADSAGSIAWKQVRVSWAKGPNPDLRIVSLRVRRGAVDMDPSAYGMYSDDITGPESTGSFTIRFREGYEAVSGGIYTVHGSVSGAKGGSYIKLSFDTSDTAVVTSGLAFDEPTADYMLADHPSSRGFIWSDLSEVPHAALVQKHGGSSDWANGYLVRGLAGSATLTL